MNQFLVVKHISVPDRYTCVPKSRTSRVPHFPKSELVGTFHSAEHIEAKTAELVERPQVMTCSIVTMEDACLPDKIMLKRMKINHFGYNRLTR